MYINDNYIVSFSDKHGTAGDDPVCMPYLQQSVFHKVFDDTTQSAIKLILDSDTNMCIYWYMDTL